MGTDVAAADGRPVRLADAADLDDLLAERSLVLVELYTAGCGICASMEPVLGNVARETDAAVAMLDLGADLPLAERFAVRRVPTLLLFRDGEVVGRLDDGFQGTAAVLAFIEDHR